MTLHPWLALGFAVWLALGYWAIQWHWRREFHEAPPFRLAVLVPILGPLAWPAGFYVHSRSDRP